MAVEKWQSKHVQFFFGSDERELRKKFNHQWNDLFYRMKAKNPKLSRTHFMMKLLALGYREFLGEEPPETP